MTLYLTSLAFCPPAYAAPGEYGWPLGREAPVAGTFGEYREGHFHTGIDFSTGGEIGMPVYAAADGEVYRVADSLTGFGKAVYLAHRDGHRTVYAHLDRFSGGIASFVAGKRRGLKFRDKLDTSVPAGEIPAVKKGDLIGYSGESGAGLPHLHFELRRDEETPIHPFEFLPAPTDHTAPNLIALLFLPVAEDEKDLPAFVNGRERNKRAVILHGWPAPPEEFVWNIRWVPSLTGKVWINLCVTDTSDLAPAHRLSPRKIIYSMDGRDTKSIEFDRLSYASQENKKVGLIYDLRSSAGGSIVRLFCGLPRPRAPSAPAAAALDVSRLSADTHVIWIRAEDINGNFSETEVRFTPFQPSEEDRQAPRWPRGSLEPFYPGKGLDRKLTSADGTVTCFLSSSMFYSSEVVTARAGSDTTLIQQSLKNDFTPPQESTLPLQASCSLEPAGTPLAAPASLTFRAPEGLAVPLEKLAVYRFVGHASHPAKWSFVSSIPDSIARTLSARIDRLALYILSDDSVAPQIAFPDNRIHSRTGELHVTASDRGSGIADTGGVEVDGKAHEEWYYDADRGWVRVRLARVKRGRHRMAVRMADRLGNVSRKEWEFRVR